MVRVCFAFSDRLLELKSTALRGSLPLALEEPPEAFF
jgi:hypothetical protein